MESLLQDLRYALRGLRTDWRLSAFVIATLSLGIGANAAMFSVADRMFVRPPPGIADPSTLRRLYIRSNWSVGQVWEIRPGFFYVAYDALKSALAPWAQLAAYIPPDTVRFGEGDAATTVRASYATAAYLPLLGVRPAFGRFFTDAEDRMGDGSPVTIVSHAFWRRHFGGDSSAVGRQLDIAWQRYTVIGVAAAGFTGADLDATEIWVPISTVARTSPAGKPWYRNWRYDPHVKIVARVAPNTADDWVSALATSTFRQGEAANVTRGADTTATVLVGPLLESRGPSITPSPEVAIAPRLMGVMVMVLIIACANVASLLLSRALRRRREIAVRLALGVTRRRLVRQLLTESVVLAVMAGIIAIGIGVWGGDVLRAMLMPVTHWGSSALDLRVALFALTLALVTGVVAGLTPAIRASRPDLASALRAGVREGTFQRSGFRNALLVAEVALSVVLLVGAGLFVRSLRGVHAIDVGYDADRIVVAGVRFLNPEVRDVLRFPEGHAAELGAGLREVAARLARVPGVENTALGDYGPMYGFAMARVRYRDGTFVPLLEKEDPALFQVSPSFFATSGLRLVRGRLFTDEDRDGAPPVIVIDQSAAKAYWPSGDAIGQCLIVVLPTNPCATVVGITRDAHREAVLEHANAQLYLPLAQGYRRDPMILTVRAAPGKAAHIADETRRELRRMFPRSGDLPWVKPLAARLEPQLLPWRLGAELFTAFGVLAVVVAALGVYSVLSYAMSQRRQEVGVRIALGAQAGHVLRLVVGEGMRTVAVGIIVGLALVMALGRLVASLLYGVSAHDPFTIAMAVLVVATVGVLASAVPAWRASRLDPMEALRTE
ncbi:MAG: ADOP family duplicated permease [Gemmatimonadales bacterium]